MNASGFGTHGWLAERQHGLFTKSSVKKFQNVAINYCHKKTSSSHFHAIFSKLRARLSAQGKPVLEHEVDKREDYMACNVSVQCVRLKEETEEHEYEYALAEPSAASASGKIVKQEPVEQAEYGDYDENAATCALYAEHEIKDELVLGPDLLQQPDSTFTQPSPPTCAVKVERLSENMVDPENGRSDSLLLTQGPSEKTNTSKKPWSLFKSSLPGPRIRACSIRLERLSLDENNPPNRIIFSKTQTRNEIKTKVCADSVCTDIYSEGGTHNKKPQKSSPNLHISQCRNYEKKPKVKCEICLRKFTSLKYLVRHIQIHIGTNNYECKICNKQFLYKMMWMRHIGTHTSNKIDSQILQENKLCNNEDTKLLSNENTKLPKKEDTKSLTKEDTNLFSHENIKLLRDKNAEAVPYECDVCMKKFLKEINLTKHRSGHFTVARYKCKICLKSFSNLRLFQRHLELHKENGSFKCEYCMKQFFKPSRLLEHTRTHTGDKPYKCNICQRGFARKRYASTHMRKCEKNKRKYKPLNACDMRTRKKYHCLLCMKEFVTHSALYMHKKRLHGTYICDICGEKFVNKDKLCVHIQDICGVFPCAICTARFANRAQLRRHARSHIWMDGNNDTPGGTPPSTEKTVLG